VLPKIQGRCFAVISNGVFTKNYRYSFLESKMLVCKEVTVCFSWLPQQKVNAKIYCLKTFHSGILGRLEGDLRCFILKTRLLLCWSLSRERV
jgi:hypothetical protein